MVYMVLLFTALAISNIIKRYIYGKSKSQGHMDWISSIYTESKGSLLIDVILAALLFIIYYKYKISNSFFTYIALSSILLTASIIDIRDKIIPDKLMTLGIVLGAVIMILNNRTSIKSALLGAVICGGTIALISIITKGAIGMGDAKLFACIGIFLGLQNTLGVMLISIMLSGLTGVILLTFKVANRKTTLPFAPFISVSTMFIVIFS